MSWISVDDRLPIEGSLVLATGFDWGDKSKKRHYVVAMRIGEYWYGVDSEFTYLTHWKPLPELPK